MGTTSGIVSRAAPDRDCVPRAARNQRTRLPTVIASRARDAQSTNAAPDRRPGHGITIGSNNGVRSGNCPLRAGRRDITRKSRPCRWWRGHYREIAIVNERHVDQLAHVRQLIAPAAV